MSQEETEENSQVANDEGVSEQEEPVEQSQDGSTMQIKQTDQVVICGKKGSGKTNLAKTLIKWLLSVGCPIIIIDPLWEYREFEQMGAIVIHIRHHDIGKFNSYLNTLYTKFHGIIVIDESDSFLPNKTSLLTPSYTLIHLGRHYGIGSIFVTRRLSNLHTDVISQTGKLFLFRLYAGADRQYLENAQLGEIVDPVFNLEKYEFVSYDADTGTSKVNEPIPKYE